MTGGRSAVPENIQGDSTIVIADGGQNSRVNLRARWKRKGERVQSDQM